MQTEEVRNANAREKSDALIILMITGNAGGGKFARSCTVKKIIKSI